VMQPGSARCQLPGQPSVNNRQGRYRRDPRRRGAIAAGLRRGNEQAAPSGTWRPRHRPAMAMTDSVQDVVPSS
jgi:hypothetical protein